MVVEPFEDTTTTLVSSFGMKGDQETASNMKIAAKSTIFWRKPRNYVISGFSDKTENFLGECLFSDSRIEVTRGIKYFDVSEINRAFHTS